jgi:Domain of unknown function (DUF4384)
MVFALALAVLMPPPVADPPIRVKISDDVFVRGERARVRVKTTHDGYLLVLRADAQGRIRVLYPLEPTADAAFRGGKEIEIRGRGDRAAFTVDDADGSGKILAAISPQPFQFDSFALSGHWDYRALAAADSGDDVEATLLSLVHQMSGGAYDYDLVTYTVTDHPSFRRAPMWGWGGWGGRWGGWYGPRCVRCGWW